MARSTGWRRPGPAAARRTRRSAVRAVAAVRLASARASVVAWPARTGAGRVRRPVSRRARSPELAAVGRRSGRGRPRGVDGARRPPSGRPRRATAARASVVRVGERPSAESAAADGASVAPGVGRCCRRRRRLSTGALRGRALDVDVAADPCRADCDGHDRDDRGRDAADASEQRDAGGARRASADASRRSSRRAHGLGAQARRRAARRSRAARASRSRAAASAARRASAPGVARSRARDLVDAQAEVARGRVELAVELGGEELVELVGFEGSGVVVVMVSGGWMFRRGLPVPEEVGERGAAARDAGAHGARAGCRAPPRSRRSPCRRGRAARPRPGIRASAARARRRRRGGRRCAASVPAPSRRGRSRAGARTGTGRRPRRRASSSAAFVATRYAQVENFERPSNEPILRAIASSASWVASSASSGLPRMRRHTPCTSAVWSRSSASSAPLSPSAARRAERVVVVVVPHRRGSLLPIDPGDAHDARAGVHTDHRTDRADRSPRRRAPRVRASRGTRRRRARSRAAR